MIDMHLIRFAGSKEHALAISAFDNVQGTRLVLPGRRMVVTREHINALERANVPFEDVTPDNANGQQPPSVQT